MSSSSFTFSFSATPKDWPADAGVWTGSAEQLKKYNAPSPCKWNDACVYSKCCGFVHAGEEGTGLKYFPGRCVTGDDGKQFWEPACLRLIGSPRFYERRRLHLSWPAWCERVGLAAPVPLCERIGDSRLAHASGERSSAVPGGAAPALSSGAIAPPDRKERIALLPTPVSSVPPMPAVTQAFIQQTAQIQAQQQWYQQMAAWQAQQQMQQFFAQIPYWRRPGVPEHAAKNALGEQIYILAKQRLEQSVADRASLGLAHPSITAGKITGMIVTAHTVPELDALLNSDDEFSRNLWQAVHVLAAHATGQDTDRAGETADAEWTARTARSARTATH